MCYQHCAVHPLFYEHLLRLYGLLYLIKVTVMRYRRIIPQGPLCPDTKNLIEIQSLGYVSMQIVLLFWFHCKPLVRIDFKNNEMSREIHGISEDNFERILKTKKLL